MDAISLENFEFIDRRIINIDLALGFLSDENRLTRQQLITQSQTAFAQAMTSIDPSVPELFAKIRRPYEDTLKVLGVKDVDAYLPTMEEAAKLAQAMAQKGPGIDEQEKMSKVEMNKAKAKETQANEAFIVRKTQDMDTDDMFEAMAARNGKLSSIQTD